MGLVIVMGDSDNTAHAVSVCSCGGGAAEWTERRSLDFWRARRESPPGKITPNKKLVSFFPQRFSRSTEESIWVVPP